MTSPAAFITCAACGAQVPIMDGFVLAACPQCGVALAPPTAPPPVAAPPHPTYIPPTPVIATQVGAILPYGALQQAGIWVAMTRRVRNSGIGNIIGGLLVIVIAGLMALGVASGSNTSTPEPVLVMLIIFGVTVLVGVALLVEGIWMTAAPSPTGLLVSAITSFTVVGLCVLSLSIGILPVLAAIYGYFQFQRWRRYGKAMSVRPSPEMEARAGALLERLYKDTAKKSPDIIEFKSNQAFRARFYRGLLADNLVVLVSLESYGFGKNVADIHFLPPTGLIIDVKRKEFLGKALKAEFYLDDQLVKGVILPQWLERLEMWKAQYVSSVQPPVPTP